MHPNALISGEEHPTPTGASPTMMDHGTVVTERSRGHTELSNCDPCPPHQQPDGFVAVVDDSRRRTLAVNHVKERT